MKTKSIIKILVSVIVMAAVNRLFANTDSYEHVDIGVEYVDNKLEIHAHSEDTGEIHQGYIFEVGPSAMSPVVSTGLSQYLGNTTGPIWILPQNLTPGLLFLGLSVEEVPPGLFLNDYLSLRLVGSNGPGEFILFSFDPFGTPQVFMSTYDGISGDDEIKLQAGLHRHVNWGFTQPGSYNLTFQAQGQLVANGEIINSDLATFGFHVIPEHSSVGLVFLGFVILVLFLRLRSIKTCFGIFIVIIGSTFGQSSEINEGHLDLSLLFNSDRTNLNLVIKDETHGMTYQPTNCVITLTEAAKFVIPDGSPLGSGGSAIWIIPQNPYPGIVYLGISGEAIDPATISTLSLNLIGKTGPGDFVLWQAAAAGLEIFMDTRDGISASDKVNVQPGGHFHFNFGFTSNGVYFLKFKVCGILNGSNQDIVSDDIVLAFHVYPLSAWDSWQYSNWPCVYDEAIIGPDADPDQDGIANVNEFVFGTNPNWVDSSKLLGIKVSGSGPSRICTITCPINTNALTMFLPAFVKSSDLISPKWEALTNVMIITGTNGQSYLKAQDEIGNSNSRFYRFQIQTR